MAHYAYHFKVDPPQPGSEIIAAMIADQGFDTFDYNDEGFTAYIAEELDGQVDLGTLVFDDFSFTYKKEKFEQQNWNAEWEKHFDPVRVDDFLLIRAPFHEREEGFLHEIVIMPKMSFGTGHHQTTRLVCRAMKDLSFSGKRILDMGCGTGILAILAFKLGATDVLAVDIDQWCVENSAENCEMNNCSSIRIFKGDVDVLENESAFDTIIANINRNILIRHLPFYKRLLKAGGTLLLSGFFTTDVEELRTVAAKHEMKFVTTSNENEWALLQLIKV